MDKRALRTGGASIASLRVLSAGSIALGGGADVRNAQARFRGTAASGAGDARVTSARPVVPRHR